MTMHGDWPLIVPDWDDPSDLSDIYEGLAAPLETGRCWCEARCRCDDCDDYLEEE